MKKFALIIIILFIVGCTTISIDRPEATFKAIYLVQEGGQLSIENLQSHPEIITTSSFDEFKQLAQHKTALWIDINAVGLVNKDWLNQEPQKFYPLVLLGRSDELCAFRDTLDVGRIEGPYADCSSPPPGFSIWMIEKDTGYEISAFMHGYEQVPTTQDILENTNLLLEGKNPLLENK